MNTLMLGLKIAEGSRHKGEDYAGLLQERVKRIQDGLAEPLVVGEEGPAYIGLALGRLMAGRSRQECGQPHGPLSQVEAWMQAGIVTCFIAATYELETSRHAPEDTLYVVQNALTDLGMRAYDEPAPVPPQLLYSR